MDHVEIQARMRDQRTTLRYVRGQCTQFAHHRFSDANPAYSGFVCMVLAYL